MNIFQEISIAIQDGSSSKVKELLIEGLLLGYEPEKLLELGLVKGMQIVGAALKNEEIYVPEVMLAARAMNLGIQILQPKLKMKNQENLGTIIIGTVQGDIHTIGKNLVKIMLESKGFCVIDLGIDVMAKSFIEAAIVHQAKIIACTSLLTSTMGELSSVVSLVKTKNLNNKIKVMIGGAPVTAAFSRKIGADIYTPDATSAAEAALQIFGL
ncbi:MAG: cobalamin-dependent protein [Clostridia bacterium]